MQTKHPPNEQLDSENSITGPGHDEKLDSQTSLGYVNLRVSDLGRSKSLLPAKNWIDSRKRNW